jgi:hypothetical protein
LIRIDGIDGHRWVERTLAADAVGDGSWADDVTSFSSVLAWAAYEGREGPGQWRWAKPKAFDAGWALRFAAAARDHGHDVDTQDVEVLKGHLAALMVSYKLDFRRTGGVNFEKFWLAASASILLAELTGDRSVRRIFPLGAARDVQLAKGLSEWALTQGGQTGQRHK